MGGAAQSIQIGFMTLQATSQKAHRVTAAAWMVWMGASDKMKHKKIPVYEEITKVKKNFRLANLTSCLTFIFF